MLKAIQMAKLFFFNNEVQLDVFFILVKDNPQQLAWWRTFLSFVGFGFLVSLGYLDPGNCMSAFDHLISYFALSSCKLINHFYIVETDLQAGADHRHKVNVHA